MNDALPHAFSSAAQAAGGAPRHWVPIRALGERHRPRVLAHLLALDAHDRQLRFGHATTDERIAHYVQALDFDHDQVFGVFDRSLRLAALVHLAYAVDDETGSPHAELGISVLPRLRRRGIGAHLLGHAMTLARNRGVRRLLVHLARDNAPMLALVRKAGAQLSFDGSDARATLSLQADSLASQMQELLGQQAGELDYRLKLQHRRSQPTA